MPAHRTKKCSKSWEIAWLPLTGVARYCITYRTAVPMGSIQRISNRPGTGLLERPHGILRLSVPSTGSSPMEVTRQHPKTTDMKGAAVLLDSRETKTINKIKNTAFLAELSH